MDSHKFFDIGVISLVQKYLRQKGSLKFTIIKEKTDAR